MATRPPKLNTMTVGERIREAREKLGLSQVVLAKRVGVSRGAIWQWETNRTQIRAAKVPKLAAVLGLDVSALSPFGSGGVAPLDIRNKSTYVVLIQWGELKHVGVGGKMKMSALNRPKYIEVDLEISPECIALKVDDGSMEPTFSKGDVIIVDPSITPRDADHVVARLTQNSEHIFRLYVQRRGGAFDLVAENPTWPTVTINARMPAEIIGVLVEHRKKRRREGS